MTSDFQFSQQFEAEEEEITPPVTTSEKLLAEVEEIESVLLNGNTHRYVIGGLGVTTGLGAIGAAAAFTAGTVAISPIGIAILGGATIFSVISYTSYVLYEGSTLNIVPAYMPLESGRTEDVKQYLPKLKKALYKAIERFGVEALNALEEQGRLEELINNITKISGKSFDSAKKDGEKAWEELEAYYITPLKSQATRKATALTQQRLAPPQAQQSRAIQTPQYKFVQPIPEESEEEDDMEPQFDRGFQPETEDKLIDLWDEDTSIPLRASSEDSSEIESFRFGSISLATAKKAPLKVISFSQIEQAASPIYKWESIASAHHIMAIGNTGAGKSTLVKYIVQTYCQDASLMILDPHAGYGDWGDIPVIGQGQNYQQIAEAFEFLMKTMKERYQVRATQRKAKFDKLFVVVDEFAAIASSTKGLSEIALRIAMEGRKVEIVLCLLAQGESVKSLKIEGQSEMKQNFTFIRLGSFAKAQAKRLGLEALAAKYDRYCFVEDQLAPLPDLAEFELSMAVSEETPQPKLSPAATVPPVVVDEAESLEDEDEDEDEDEAKKTPALTANDLLTYLYSKKNTDTFAVNKLSANLSRKNAPITVPDVIRAAEDLAKAGTVKLINWDAKQGRAIFFERHEAKPDLDNVVELFPIQVC